jgi:hypothetical protein
MNPKPEQIKSSFLKIPKVPGFEKCGNIFGSRLPEHQVGPLNKMYVL